MPTLLTNAQAIITLLSTALVLLGILNRASLARWWKNINRTLVASATQAAQKGLDDSQQVALGNYKDALAATKDALEAMNLRVRVLEAANQEKDARHETELVKLRGDFASEMAKSAEVIASLNTRISEQDVLINDLRLQLREATDLLALAARRMIASGERPDRPSRVGDHAEGSL